MPFWYDWEPNKYNNQLNDDSMLSIDDQYDPEKDIEVVHFITISRLLNYKENFARYLRMNKAHLKPENINKCVKLM